MSKLPVEVFLLICENVVERQAWRPFISSSHVEHEWEYTPKIVKNKYIRPLLTLTHVCRAWRNAVIGFPSLWAYEDVVWMSQPLIDTFAERARTVRRLCQTFDLACMMTRETERLATDIQSPQLRHAMIYLRDSKESLQQYGTHFPLKAPNLESLSIAGIDPVPVDVGFARLSHPRHTCSTGIHPLYELWRSPQYYMLFPTTHFRISRISICRSPRDQNIHRSQFTSTLSAISSAYY